MIDGETLCSAMAVAPPARKECLATSVVKNWQRQVMTKEQEGIEPASVSQRGEAMGWRESREER